MSRLTFGEWKTIQAEERDSEDYQMPSLSLELLDTVIYPKPVIDKFQHEVSSIRYPTIKGFFSLTEKHKKRYHADS